MTDYKSIYDFAIKNGCKAEFNEPLKKHTSFKIGGNASLFIVPEDDKALSEVLKKCTEENARVLLLGNGSNMLVCDEGIDAVVILMLREKGKIELIDNNLIKCDAGVSLTKVCRYAYEKSLSGIEFAFGIPGSVGGAVYMNAGAYGGEIKDVIVECEYMTYDGQIRTISKDDMCLGYRTSIFNSNNFVILKSVIYNNIL